MDAETEPTDYVYVSRNCVTTNDVNVDYKITTLQSCTCEDRCNNAACSCAINSLRCWYDEEGKLVSDFNYSGELFCWFGIFISAFISSFFKVKILSP